MKNLGQFSEMLDNMASAWLAQNDCDPLDLAIGMDCDAIQAQQIDASAYMDFQAYDLLDDEIDWNERFTVADSPIGAMCTPTDWYRSAHEEIDY